MRRWSKTMLTPEERVTWDRGLRMLARMIAEAYLRDVRGTESPSMANSANSSGTGDRTQRDPFHEIDAKAAPDDD